MRGLRGSYASQYEMDIENCLRWRSLPKPIVAAVQGYCIWHGCAVLSCADVIFAADNARFLPFFLQYFSMPFEIGVRKAKELIFRQRFMMPEEAERVGFVNNVVPLEELAETCAARPALAQKLCANCLAPLLLDRGWPRRFRVREYAEDVALNDSFFLRMVKKAVNGVHEQAGFTTHINASWDAMMANAGAAGDPQAEGYNTKDGIAVAVAQLKAHGMAPRKLAEGAKL